MTIIRDMLAVPNQPIVETKREINSIISRVIIHNNRPIENLPLIPSPELKIIGRCVTFVADTVIGGESKRFHYEGLVSIINKNTVTLINVYRFTDKDFEIHREEQKREMEMQKTSQDNKDFEMRERSELLKTQSTKIKASRQAERLLSHANTTSNNEPIVNRLERLANSNEEVFTLQTGEDVVVKKETKDIATARNKLELINEFYGPIPYMTFIRSHIHNVEFAHDPTSSFYSLFRDPSREIFDMQCLRMFVRRYLVHTSQGNNPRQVPLRAFVTCRCNCPNIDKELLKTVALEELINLYKVSEEIKQTLFIKERKMLNDVIQFRAPKNIFKNTGALYVTKLPQVTFFTACVLLLLTLAFILYFVMLNYKLNVYIFEPYMQIWLPYYIVSAVFFFLSSVTMLLHSIKMTIFLISHYKLLCLRLCLSILVIIWAIVIIVIAVLTTRLVSFESTVKKKISHADICKFQMEEDCNGYKFFCIKNVIIEPFCVCDAYLRSANTCHYKIHEAITTPLYANYVLCALFIILAIRDLFLMRRLWRTMGVVARLNRNMLLATNDQIESLTQNQRLNED